MTSKTAISFVLQSGLSAAQREKAVEDVKSIKGVFNVAALDPASSSKAIRNMYFAYLDAAATPVESTLAQIRAVNGVKYAELPPQRRLMAP